MDGCHESVMCVGVRCGKLAVLSQNLQREKFSSTNGPKCDDGHANSYDKYLIVV